MLSGSKSLFKTIAAATLALGFGTIASQADDFPSKPINYIIPFGPGGESDITARHQQPFFKKMFGQDLVISYKPGGGGATAWAQLNSMPNDGYTIMGINLPHIIIKPMQKDVGFKTEDLAGFYMFHYTPDAIVVTNDSPFKSLDDLIKFAKEKPGELTFSGSGKGTANHLAQVTFDKLAGVKTTYVPFKGTGAAVQALLGNQVVASWGYTSVGAKHADKARMLAVAMEERHPAFPDVPTFKELGFDIVSGAYRGIAVPKSTPPEIQKKLSDMIGKINADPEFRKRMEADGFSLVDVGVDGMEAFLAEKAKGYAEAAKEADVIK
ncbi:Tripartite-type tricarboxylate transporter, receptor component TctC [Filomicrobium insigne]|uniref:Tripartite-type tricarboxylate transporter, receptor component TctC n=1 Tax=Filomicrobium insigne TaxID=418854 RepID=A0A1H0H371_9HYPH|nr:tripartite tricarboxylate transporter substrate binding protein [Filomicrobium insigne]SDO13597.1 Tripartite-type tricarboxylate transporter, receptor component TctC [Filomicrobium insigne]